MSWRFRNIMLVLGGIFAFLIFTAIGVAYAMQDKITQIILSEINQQITVPVQPKGGIELSLLKHFPYASLTLRDVSIDDKLQNGKKLLDVKEFSLLCNVMSLFGKQIELSKIYISNGNINIFKDSKGNTNYDITKPRQDTTGTGIAIQLKRAEIKNVRVTYIDKTVPLDIDVQVKDLFLKGDFSSQSYDLAANIEALVNKVDVRREAWASNRNLKADIVLNVDNNKRQYTFKKGNVAVDQNQFDITGFFALLAKGTQLDFKLTNAGKDMQKLFKLIPEKYRGAFSEANGSGQYSITATVKGIAGKNASPRINVDADLKNSEVRLGRYNKFLKQVNATARYEMDEHGHDKLIISNFNCTLNDLPFNFRLTLNKLSNPDFDFYAHGVFNLSEIRSFVPDSVMQGIGGTITFDEFHLKGRKKDFTDVDHSTLSGSGNFKLKGVEFTTGGISYGNINGLLSYKDQIIDAQNLTTNFLSTEAVFSGKVQHLLPFIFNLSAKRSANNVVLDVDGWLRVKTLNLSGIVEAYNKKNHPQVEAKGKIDLREVINMQGNLQVEIQKFIFRKLEFENIKGNLALVPGAIQLNNVFAQGMGGDIGINGKIVFGDDYTLHMKYYIDAKNLSVPEIFYECENFGQNALTDNNLKGTLTAQVSFNSVWNNYSRLDPASLTALVNFDIKNGELIKFAPLKAAAKFIKVNELEDIKFADLANTIQIANERIDIPQFEIQSSALNLMIAGYHYFNNTIDYHLKINLHKLLAQKFNRKREDLEYMQEDPYEGINLYLSLKGNLSNPKIKFDKGIMKKKMAADFKNEKANLKNLIHNTPAPKMDDNEKKSEEKYFDVNKAPQFIDFDSSDGK